MKIPLLNFVGVKKGMCINDFLFQLNTKPLPFTNSYMNADIRSAIPFCFAFFLS